MKKWPEFEHKDGLRTIWLKEWNEFHAVLKKLLHSPRFVYRGQQQSNWKLESSLARIIKGHPKISELMDEHLRAFKLASRGRRGSNPPDFGDNENEWWALGQHHGLATPLLDWTSSPYVALFFALCDDDLSDQTSHRVVYALNTVRVLEKSAEVEEDNFGLFEEISFFQPFSHENTRLVAQAGSFTKCPIETDVESWVKHHFKSSPVIALVKIHVPNSDRQECLQALNVMNINHATLFPDLYGAGRHATELLQRKLIG